MFVGEWTQQGYYLFGVKTRIWFLGNNQWRAGVNVLKRIIVEQNGVDNLLHT